MKNRLMKLMVAFANILAVAGAGVFIFAVIYAILWAAFYAGIPM